MHTVRRSISACNTPIEAQGLQPSYVGCIDKSCPQPARSSLQINTPAPDGTANTGLRAVLYEQRGAILRFLTLRSGNADLAHDLFQDLWLRLSHADPGPIANPVAYLMRAANNCVLDYRRGELRARTRDAAWLDADDRAMLPPELLADPAAPADEAMEAKQEIEALRSAIELLPPGARRALILHRIEGLAQADVADAMGISRSGVEKHIAVAMKQLRRTFANWGPYLSAASDKQSDLHEPAS